MGGLEKVTAERPSTAAFGNWGVLGALKRYNDDRFDVDIAGCLFMGRKRARAAKVEVPLSPSDDAQTIENQWAALRSAFLAKVRSSGIEWGLMPKFGVVKGVQILTVYVFCG